MSGEHIPVLADKIDELVEVARDGVVVDCTCGYGGHSRLLGEKLGREGVLAAFDVDSECLEAAGEKLEGLECRILLKNNNFRDISAVLVEEGIEKADFILADLGWCSGQLEDWSKGLSFMENQPLDMRLDRNLERNAEDIVNNTKEDELADLIYKYGEEKASRRIAKFIAEFRRDQPIKSTGQLSFIICKAIGKSPRPGSIHPATRTFQALRIAVNNELVNLEMLLKQSPDLLKSGGKIAIISFHSLEDRIVKQNFRDNKKAGIYNLITKKPLTPSDDEFRQNPRSRSSKLRIAERV